MRRWYIERNYIYIGYYAKMPSFAAKGGILCYERWHLLHKRCHLLHTPPLTIRIRGIRDVSYFFTGTLARISSRCFQNLSTVGISIRSWGECTPLQSRTKGNHIQCRVLIEEQTAFQSGMDGFHLGIYTE